MKSAIYLRQSLDRDQTQLAVDRQREDLLRLCRQRGWDDPVEYCDNSVSATRGTRPAYVDLCDDIANGAVGRVAVWDLDRLYRQPRELEDFIDLVDRFGVELANVGGDIDLSAPQGRMFARMKGAVARYEIDQMIKRKKAANQQRAQRGKAWNVRTFGYDGDDIVRDEAEALRGACEAVLKGDSLYGIAKQWNSAGIKTIKGGEWTGGTVRQVLSRARNAGLQTYDGQIVEGVKTSWPAIVSRDTFDAVRAVLADPKRATGKRRARAHLLSGLAICGLCGKKMFTTQRSTKKGAKRVVYQCKAMGCMKVVRDLAKTDALVVDIVTRRLARPDAAKVFAKRTVDTKALTAQANQYRELIAAAEREYDEGIIDGRRLKGRKNALQPKLNAIETELVGANTSRKLDGLLGNPKAAEVFAALPLDRRRAVIDVCCEVTVEPAKRAGGRFDHEDISIRWR